MGVSFGGISVPLSGVETYERAFVAQRMHTASLRSLETAHEMLREVLELGE